MAIKTVDQSSAAGIYMYETHSLEENFLSTRSQQVLEQGMYGRPLKKTVIKPPQVNQQCVV